MVIYPLIYPLICWSGVWRAHPITSIHIIQILIEITVIITIISTTNNYCHCYITISNTFNICKEEDLKLQFKILNQNFEERPPGLVKIKSLKKCFLAAWKFENQCFTLANNFKWQKLYLKDHCQQNVSITGESPVGTILFSFCLATNFKNYKQKIL